MSDLLNKLFLNILKLVFIVLFITTFREMILSNEDVSAVFKEILGIVPFAEVVGDFVCGVLGCEYELPVINQEDIIWDLLKLAFMSSIQPYFNLIFEVFFLPSPKKNQILSTSLKKYELEEANMNSFNYKIRELLLNVIFTPLIAYASLNFSELFFEFFKNNIGGVVAFLLESLLIVFLNIISLIPLLVAGVSFLTAILWRLLVTITMKMTTTFVTNAIFVTAYIFLINGMESQIITVIITYIICIIFLDFLKTCLQKAILS